MLDLVFNRFTTVVFFEANLRHQLQKMSDSAAQYIHWDTPQPKEDLEYKNNSRSLKPKTEFSFN